MNAVTAVWSVKNGAGVSQTGCEVSKGVWGVENGVETHVRLLVRAFLEEIVWGWVHTRGGVSKLGSGVSWGVQRGVES
jgi:hypothetical protein